MRSVRSREDGHLASFEGEVGWEVWSQKELSRRNWVESQRDLKPVGVSKAGNT